MSDAGDSAPLLGAQALAATAATIVAMQEQCGAIPWTPGEHTDIWNHVESAMALTVAGEYAAADRAYAWAASQQRADGSMPLKIVDGRVEDASGETNVSAYLAVGVWHHWLIRRDRGFVERCWPVVARGLDWVCARQRPSGVIAWSQEWADGAPARVNDAGLLAGCSSIHHSLQAGLALAALLGEERPTWSHAGIALAHVLRHHRDHADLLDKATFSMDWYYPVLGGAVRGEAGRALLASRWDDFVVPDLGVRCVDTNPWVTGAESCELAMALDAVGERAAARRVWQDVQHLRTESGAYWTGLVFPEQVNWPVEHTTYTAAAVILAADALDGLTPGSGIMRGDWADGDWADGRWADGRWADGRWAEGRWAEEFDEIGCHAGCPAG